MKSQSSTTDHIPQRDMILSYSDPGDCYPHRSLYPSSLFAMHVSRCEIRICRSLNQIAVYIVYNLLIIILYKHHGHLFLSVVIFSLHLTAGIPQYECTMISFPKSLLIYIGSDISLLSPVLNTFYACAAVTVG